LGLAGEGADVWVERRARQAWHVAVLTLVMLFYSVYSFGKAERSFADII
jgi:hypothetical protein